VADVAAGGGVGQDRDGGGPLRHHVRGQGRAAAGRGGGGGWCRR
jgi:hypothetical protein